MALVMRTKIGHEDYETAVGTQAPLATVWTEPASCITAIPTISAGFRDTESCSAYPPASVESIFSDDGAGVNYPDFTTNQAQTSKECMPSGYANLDYFYFTGGAQCPLSWATATVANDSFSKTIACCPSAYPNPLYIASGGYDCYTISHITADQQFILVAKGAIYSSRTADSESSYVHYWESESIIGTTQWPTATTASLFHPGVNFLVQLPTSTPGSSPGNSTTSGSPAFSILVLGLGGSIGVVVGIAVVGIACLACLFNFFQRCFGPARRRSPPLTTVIYQAPGAQYVSPPDSQYRDPNSFSRSSSIPPAQYKLQPLAYQSNGV